MFKKLLLTIILTSLIFSPALAGVKNTKNISNYKENKVMGKITQTAGRDQLGNFAPEFAHFNDDILFGENWNNQDIDVKTRCIVTVVSLASMGITDSSLKYHLENAKKVVLRNQKLLQLLLITHFMPGGQRLGLFLDWQKKFGLMMNLF